MPQYVSPRHPPRASQLDARKHGLHKLAPGGLIHFRAGHVQCDLAAASPIPRPCQPMQSLQHRGPSRLSCVHAVRRADHCHGRRPQPENGKRELQPGACPHRRKEHPCLRYRTCEHPRVHPHTQRCAFPSAIMQQRLADALKHLKRRQVALPYNPRARPVQCEVAETVAQREPSR